MPGCKPIPIGDGEVAHAGLVRQARDILAKAQEATRELNLAHSTAVQAQMDAEGEWDQLKAQVEGFGASLAKA